MSSPVPSLPPAFFLPLGDDRFQATVATQGPWDPSAMHGGPVAALLATLLTAKVTELSPSLRLARLSVDFLGPLPVAELAAVVTIPRPGRRVALLEATLSAGDRAFAVGRGWFIDSSAAGDADPSTLAGAPVPDAELAPLGSPPPLPDPQTQRYFVGLETFGYGVANEWRFTSGGFDQHGPAGVWSLARIPLIEGAPLTGLQRLLILADAANGISGDLPFGEWMFIPPGITVTILREPVGEWVHMSARTTLGHDGIGLCHAQLADSDGPVAIASQPLLVTRM